MHLLVKHSGIFSHGYGLLHSSDLLLARLQSTDLCLNLNIVKMPFNQLKI